jgi:hypothetical protein
MSKFFFLILSARFTPLLLLLDGAAPFSAPCCWYEAAALHISQQLGR